MSLKYSRSIPDGLAEAIGGPSTMGGARIHAQALRPDWHVARRQPDAVGGFKQAVQAQWSVV